MNLDAAKQTFIAECHELLQEMEDSLLRLETETGDKDLLSALFRTAHTIKGSAGLFGLDYIVGFTHLVENVLDKMRDGELAYESDLAALLLECGDHIGDLVEVAAEGTQRPDAETLAREKLLIERLRAILGVGDHAREAEAVAPQAGRAQLVAAGDGAQAKTDNWHISLRFGADVLRNGMDPLSFIRYLGTLGEIVHIVTVPDAMPPIEEMDAESCYLGFEIQFKSDADKETIAGVFDFVREDSIIRILPPHSSLSDYVDLIKSLPEEEARLGELLVASGAITQADLDQGMQIQACPVKLEARGYGYKVSAGECGPSDKTCLAQPTLDCTAKKPLGEILVEQGVVRQEVVDAALDKQKQVREKKGGENQYIRVDAGKLDQLINMVGELVIGGASISLLAKRARDPVLHESAATMARLVENIRDGALQLRMVQIGETFNRFQRVVRDVSKELGKDIQLVVSGAEAELDKTVVEKIGDPLMHLVRNAMDHGIEPAAVRQSRGKPAKGTLRLNAYHDSGSIVIEVADDGGGLNREKILRKAVGKGIVAAGQNLSDQEVYGLIFEAGFSTAEAVTNLSGRGVGMDVVRRNIEALRGTTEIASEEGQGTTIRIRLPLTLAIIDGFLMGVGSAAYMVPLDMVVECLELSADQREATRSRNYINLRGEVLPFLRLREQFEVEGKSGRRENIVVVQCAGQKAGLVVDELMGEFQAVIKPLGKLFCNIKGISGSTILGTGAVALILDVPSLIQQATNAEALAVASSEEMRVGLTR